MRRQIVLILMIMTGAIVLLTAWDAAASHAAAQPAVAQDEAPPAHEPILEPLDPHAPPVFGPLSGVWRESVDVEAQQVPDPFLTEAHASDSCSEAPALPLQNFGTAGDASVVNNMTSDPSDPVLGCQWRPVSNPRGWRTVWYKFVAPVSGHLQLKTSFEASDFQDSYDTVMALYQSADGTCGALNMLGCDDDSNGFFSELNTFVIEGRTYYIEVADRSFDVQGPATLRLSVVLEEGESFWQRFESSEYSEPAARSRHALVSDGRFIYLISGERVVEDFPVPAGRLDRFDSLTRTWTNLRPIPRPYYSRTSAALLGGHIYVPSGYTGNNQAYDGTHYIYSIATNEWTIGASVPWASASASGRAYAWHQAVASPPNNGYFLTGGLLEGDPSQLVPPISIVPTGSLLFYNANNGQWRTDLPDMTTPRFAHVAARLNTPQGAQICVAGGLTRLDRDPDDLAGVVNSVECYNIATQTWSDRAAMNFPRFSAGSAVGPDGKWYVFGGVNSQLNNVTLTEVYDPATNTWTVLDSRYSVRRPGRAWVRGAFATNGLWIFGGEEVPGNEVVPLVERLAAPSGMGPWIPAVFGTGVAPVEPNDTMARANFIALGQEVQQTFETFEDYFDFFAFQVTQPDEYVAHLSSIPAERDYDVYIYNYDKLLVGHSFNIGNLSETAVTFQLTPGVYYVMVMRAFGEPFGSPYRLVVTPTGPDAP